MAFDLDEKLAEAVANLAELDTVTIAEEGGTLVRGAKRRKECQSTSGSMPFSYQVSFLGTFAVSAFLIPRIQRERKCVSACNPSRLG